MTGPDGKIDGYTPGMVRDPEARGVALLVHVHIEGAKDSGPAIAARMFPKKQRNGSCRIIRADGAGGAVDIDVLIGATKQQCGIDVVRAAAKAAGVSRDSVTYVTSAGVKCSPTADMPGSPRAGQSWTNRQRNVSPHR